MIKVKCLASGSTGNSYAIDDGNTVLLLEAGISAKRMIVGYGKLFGRISGCLITHEHQDHAKAASELANMGIDLYASSGTFESIKAKVKNPYRLNIISAGKQFSLGSWIILPWEAQHDAAEPLGFLIYSKNTNERLLFATDTYYIPNTFKSLNYIMIECNYNYETLCKSVSDGKFPESHKIRIMQSHFGIGNVKEFLRSNDLSKINEIFLIHVSNINGNCEAFKDEIQRLTGLLVTVF